MATPADVETPEELANEPLGLALGSIRGFMSLLICVFFWLVLLWPGDTVVRPFLGHFFLLSLVLMAFASNPNQGQGPSLLPWLLRLLFAGGSVLVVLYVLGTDPGRLRSRLTPDPAEFQQWWAAYLAIMFGGFAVGLFLRYILGRRSHLFQTLRAWVAVIAMIMLSLEIGLVIMWMTMQNKPEGFAEYWEAVELAFAAAYFGTRA